MEVVISRIFPQAMHRCCQCHILKKAKECLGLVYTKKNEFRTEFHKVVNHILTIDEFDTAWGMLLDKYSLRQYPYITQI